MATIPLPAFHDLAPDSLRQTVVRVFAVWFGLATALVVLAASTPVATQLVGLMGPTAAHAVIGFPFVALASVWLAWKARDFEIFALFIGIGAFLILGFGMPAVGAWMAGDPSRLAQPGPSFSGRVAGWAYLDGAQRLAQFRKKLVDERAHLEPAQLARLAPLPDPFNPMATIAAARHLKGHPPLTGDAARRFVLAARLAGYLPSGHAQALVATGFVSGERVAAARQWAQVHVPDRQDNALVQQAWLRLVGEQSWDGPFDAQEPARE